MIPPLCTHRLPQKMSCGDRTPKCINIVSITTASYCVRVSVRTGRVAYSESVFFSELGYIKFEFVLFHNEKNVVKLLSLVY